jgi:hypothetical protein
MRSHASDRKRASAMLPARRPKWIPLLPGPFVTAPATVQGRVVARAWSGKVSQPSDATGRQIGVCSRASVQRNRRIEDRQARRRRRLGGAANQSCNNGVSARYRCHCFCQIEMSPSSGSGGGRARSPGVAQRSPAIRCTGPRSHSRCLTKHASARSARRQAQQNRRGVSFLSGRGVTF